MAQLRDTVISGSLRATDTIYTNKIQTSIIGAPTSSNGATFGVGTNGQVLKSNGTSVYWASDSAGVTSVRVQATSPVTSSTNTAQTGSLDTTIALANNYGDTKNPYASKTKNTVLAAPATADGVPLFRALVENDIPTISAAKASLGNVSNNANLNSANGAKGDIIYWSAANTPAHLTNTSSTTKQFLSITSQVPSWSAVSKGDVGLGNVDNTSDANKPISTATQTALNAKLPLAGGTMTGTLKTSFKGSVAFGSYGASATTIENLCEELRYSSGAIGSVNITTAYTKDTVTIPTGWYNFLWIPHRSGGVNGQANGDNCNYGSLYLTNMTANESQFFFIHWTAASGVVALEDSLHTVLDYNNNTRIRFGYSTSGMTSANWLAAWDGYKLRAIAPGNLSIKPSQITDGFTTNPFYINTHPEAGPAIIPFINNDIAFLLKRGGSAVVKYDGVVKNVDISNVFDGSPSYWAINPTDVTEITIELTLHKEFTWTNTIYVDHGSNAWRSKYVKIEVMNTNHANDVWAQKLEETARTLGRSKVTMTHTPVGTSSAGYGFNKIRFTFKDWGTSTIFRIAQIGVINYGSAGLRETSMSRGIDDPIFRSITPNEDNTYMLGTSSKRWSGVYAQTGNFAGGITGNLTGDVTGKVNGHTVNADVPSGAKFTDTTYTAATAAPGKIASASAQGTSTNYARQDHTHGIDVGTGDSNGQVKIAGQNASVKGLAALAYKASLTASDIPELNASKITAGTLPVSRGGTGATSFTANSVIMSGSTTTAALTTRAITDNSSNADVTSSDTNLITGRTLYYQLAKKGYLTSHQTIKQDSVTGATANRYATCAIAAGTAAKTASITSGTFTLETGATVRVKFTYSNTATNPTLNINSTGAKPIYKFGTTRPGATPEDSWDAGEVVTFVYDGAGWQMSSNPIMGLTASQVANLFNLIG